MGLAVCLLAVFLTGCNNGTIDDDVNKPGTLPVILVGKWANYDEYIIKTEIIEGKEEHTIGYLMNDDEWPFEYKGTIRFVSNYNSSSGIIIIEYTNNLFSDPNKPFTGIYYRDLTSTTVKLANAINLNDNYSSADTATLEEAIKKFTLGRMGNYIDWSVVTPYNKVP
jgi:hypothetical protein